MINNELRRVLETNFIEDIRKCLLTKNVMNDNHVIFLNFNHFFSTSMIHASNNFKVQWFRLNEVERDLVLEGIYYDDLDSIRKYFKTNFDVIEFCHQVFLNASKKGIDLRHQPFYYDHMNQDTKLVNFDLDFNILLNHSNQDVVRISQQYYPFINLKEFEIKSTLYDYILNDLVKMGYKLNDLWIFKNVEEYYKYRLNRLEIEFSYSLMNELIKYDQVEWQVLRILESQPTEYNVWYFREWFATNIASVNWLQQQDSKFNQIPFIVSINHEPIFMIDDQFEIVMMRLLDNLNLITKKYHSPLTSEDLILKYLKNKGVNYEDHSSIH